MINSVFCRFDPGDSLIVLESQVSVNTGKRVTAIVR